MVILPLASQFVDQLANRKLQATLKPADAKRILVGPPMLVQVRQNHQRHDLLLERPNQSTIVPEDPELKPHFAAGLDI